VSVLEGECGVLRFYKIAELAIGYKTLYIVLCHRQERKPCRKCSPNITSCIGLKLTYPSPGGNSIFCGMNVVGLTGLAMSNNNAKALQHI